MNRAIPPRTQPASGVRSGMSPTSKVMAWLLPNRSRPAPNAGTRTAASVIGRLGGLVDAADQRPQRARAVS